ncbi:hypothetical protein EMIHUDRAFT_200263 [Emiliania huxleyi CCMP1516]|uniref:Uncharacterized protein n=2 Tax=Emiliania huxleyi TaxID=2903 RepID=A0A0D3KV95_EMIH1|nr:hypothetical protein EMIHUDRAFT_200263 [Emiliania huxleyi CCMP1516]EOD39680.1 hypothetical protein EMIHUDRAFT_200263 [Emiliania huxleyi CCMP1516]|eukprot:XP_005792109.1 hypothetical protein EMIHUDRAFT_200263 [Emiliania huxleyi CCMP1516]
MGRVLKRFLKEHAAYAAAGVAATARGIGEAASGEESEDQSFYVAMALLFALAFIGGFLPMILQKNDAILCVGDCFSGGLLVGAALMHMLPESAELNEMLAGEEEEEDEDMDAHGRALHGEGEEETYPWSFLLCSVALISLMAIETAASGTCCSTADKEPAKSHVPHHHSLGGLETTGKGGKSGAVAAIAAFTAFIIHCVLEGLALGVVGDDIMVMFVAVGAHKGFAAFALGAAAALCMFCFSIATPIGMLIGHTAATAEGAESPLPLAFNALAAGTFLQMGAVEVLGSEMMEGHGKCPGIVKYLFAMMGFAVMAVLALYC